MIREAIGRDALPCLALRNRTSNQPGLRLRLNSAASSRALLRIFLFRNFNFRRGWRAIRNAALRKRECGAGEHESWYADFVADEPFESESPLTRAREAISHSREKRGPRMSPDQTAGREMPAAEAISVASLVSYQAGSVVSRTIVKRPVGTVTLFASLARTFCRSTRRITFRDS